MLNDKIKRDQFLIDPIMNTKANILVNAQDLQKELRKLEVLERTVKMLEANNIQLKERLKHKAKEEKFNTALCEVYTVLHYNFPELDLKA